MPTPDLGAVSVAQLKQELGIASTDTAKDTVLAALALRVTKLIEAEIGYTLVYPGTDYIDTFDILSLDVHELWLGNMPIRSITSVHEDLSRTYGAATLRTEDIDFLANYQQGSLVRIGGWTPYYWMQGFRTVQVQYSAGWEDDADKTNIPAVANEVALKLGALTFREIEMRQQGKRQYVTSQGSTISNLDQQLTTVHLTETMRQQLTDITMQYDYPGNFQRHRSLPVVTP